MPKQITAEDSEQAGREIEFLANKVAQDTREVFDDEPTVASVSKFVLRVSKTVDDAIDKYQHKRLGLELDCKKGCCWCCNEIVVASVPEIISVFHHIQTHFGKEEKEAFLQRLENYEEKMGPRRSKTFTLTREPCPLLVDSACSVYEARPLECRGKSSENANVCRMWSEAPGDGGTVPNFIAQKMVARAGARGLSYGSMAEPSSVVHEMSRCLAMLFKRPALADEVISGKSTFPAVVPAKGPTIFQFDNSSFSPPEIGNHPFNTAISLAKVGRFKEAEALVDPGSAFNMFVRMRAPGMYSSLDQIYEYRDRLDKALDELSQVPLNPVETLVALGEHNMASLPYQGLPVKDLLQKQGRIFQQIVSRAYPHLCAPIENPRKPGRFRLGYVSGALMLNNGSRWALGWLKNHNPEFETFALNLGPEDIASKIWSDAAEHYYNLHGNLQRIAEFIRSLDLDALIITDLAFRKKDYIYFSMRLARIQCTAWGVPCTSGLPNVDYYLSSDYMEPEGAESEYTEGLVRLPRTGLCYPRPKSKFWEGEFHRESTGFFPFMAQNIRKWTPQKDYLLKRIADRFGKPLKMISLPEKEETEIFSNRLTQAGVAHEILPTTMQMGFAHRLAAADVSFDPPDWSGGNTTIEALLYGVPVVALPGPYMRGRHSLAFLKMANAEGLVAKDEDDYIDLIFNEERRRDAMKNLNADALFEDKGVVGALDEFLLKSSPGIG